MRTILETIKQNLNNDLLFEILLPLINQQIETPDTKYGVISPMYSLMPLFFDYYNVEELSKEQMKEADRIIKVVDDAFGGGWYELASKISQQQDLRAKEMINELRHTRNIIKALSL